MRLRFYIILVCIPLLLAGCRRNAYQDTYIEALNAEKRLLEDHMYDLEYEVKARNDRIRALENQVARLNGRGDSSPSLNNGSGSGSVLNGSDDGGPSPTPPAGDGPDVTPPSIDLSPPTIEGGTPVGPEVLKSGKKPADPSKIKKVDYQEPAPYEPPRDQRVTHVVIDPLQSGGHNFDQVPGPDGIAVVFQPRNLADEFIDQAGEVSVAAVDPELPQEESVLSQWDFNAHEIYHRTKVDPADERGVHLKLAWRDKTPKGDKVVVYVRFTTDDGRTMETRSTIRMKRRTKFSKRWTPRPAVNLPGKSKNSQENTAPSSAGDQPSGGLEASTRTKLESIMSRLRHFNEKYGSDRNKDATAAAPPRSTLHAEPQQPAPQMPAWSPYRD